LTNYNKEILENNSETDSTSDDNEDINDSEVHPNIEFQEVDLDQLDADEVIEELFEKINPITIPSIIIGVVLLIISYTSLLDNTQIGSILVGFAGGLSFVFGCSELIIFGVKGIGQKFGWSVYFMGIIAAIGADSSDVIVVAILLMKAKKLSIDPLNTGNIALANDLTLTSITFVLTTVLINTLVLGVTMIIVSRKKPFKLPKELTETEANLVLAMTIFSFILLSFGITHNAIGIEQFDKFFQGVMGASLLLFYIMFVAFLILDARSKSSEKIGPQTLIPEYFPEEDTNGEENEEEHKKGLFKKFFDVVLHKNEEDEEGEQFVALRRFPWYIIVIAFAVGIAGISFGGILISNSIETSIAIFNVPILIYCVVVGFVSSAPETTITMRALFSPEEEDTRMGLVHQISSINQTFFLLFGFPFLFSTIIGIQIPVAFDTTLVLAGIFAISLALHLTIIDDNHFDRVEGALILFASITSLLALATIGGLLS